jgi:NAD kinase
VYIEKAVFNSEIVRSHPRIREALDDSCLRSFDSTIQTSSIDFVVCLGGDGTFLHAASLFQVGNYNYNVHLNIIISNMYRMFI